MNWRTWFVENGDSTTYWFATGEKPDINLCFRRAIWKNRDKLQENARKNGMILMFNSVG